MVHYTYRERLSPLLDDKALYEVGEDLRFDHGLGQWGPVPVPVGPSGQRQGQGGGTGEGRGGSRRYREIQYTFQLLF